MAMDNLIEYSDTYFKTIGRLWQYYTFEPALDNNSTIADFLADSLKFKTQIQQTKQATMAQKMLK